MMENRSRNYAGTFNSEVIKWRQLASRIWSILIILSFILIHSVTANWGFNNLTHIIFGFFTTILSLNFWTYSLVILVIFWVMFMFHDRLFTVTPKVYANNFEKLFQIVYSMDMVCIIANTIASLFISSMLLNLYESKERYGTFYICAFCGFSNLFNSLKFTFDGRYLLNWPVSQEPKKNRFKLKLQKIILENTKSVIYNFLIWNIFYFIVGSGIVNTLFGSSNGESNGFFSAVYNGVSSILISLKLSFLINLSYSISWDLYEIYMTEMYHFNIQPSDAADLPLPTAMSLNSHPYIQTLAFIDFADLSANSMIRRSQLLSLNFNNQPVNWNKVSNEAMNVIKGFMEVFNFDDMLHGVNHKRINPLSPKKDLLFPSSPLSSPVRRVHLNETYDVHRSPEKLNKTIPVQSFTLIESLINKLKKQKYFAVVYKENPNYKSQQLFVDSFLVINALKGLSNMVQASLDEDEYGLVQQNLPDIINTFISVQKIVEKFNLSSTNTNRLVQESHSNQIEFLIQKLSFTLNESIYKIIHTFGSSIKSLGLSDDVLKRIMKYETKQSIILY